MSGLLPNYILREFDNAGRLLSWGKIYFYESGTYIAKPTYIDATLATPNTNPVILDAGGAADIWLEDGAYRVYITDLNDVQIRSPIDGISATGSGATGSIVTVDTYNDLRALATTPDTVYVTGRNTAGDGGQGLFQLLPASPLTDDDGVVLINAIYDVYQRVLCASIDPLWYGVKYDDNSTLNSALTKACNGAIQFKLPLQIINRIYLPTDFAVPGGTYIQCASSGYFYSAIAHVINFNAGCKFESVGIAFGVNVSPRFDAQSICDVIKLSWMGGSTDNEKLAKFAGASTYNYTALVDISATESVAGIIFPANLAIDFANGAKISLTGVADITIPNLIYTGRAQIISHLPTGIVDITAPEIYPEWFGAIGDGVADDSVAINAAFMCGKAYLTGTYKITSAYSYDSLYLTGLHQSSFTDTWVGGSLVLDTGATLNCTELSLQNVSITSPAVNAVMGSNLLATNSLINQTTGYIGYSFATSVRLSLCRLYDALFTTASLTKVDCQEGVISDRLVVTTKLDVGLNRVKNHSQIKSATGYPYSTVWPYITADNPSVLFIENNLQNFQLYVEDAASFTDPTGNKYFKIIPLFQNILITISGHFMVGRVVMDTLYIAGLHTYDNFMWIELFAGPIMSNGGLQTTWQVVYGPKFP